MKPSRNKYYLQNFIFIICVAVLVFNDHYLKFSSPGLLTGKLSDGVGIIILPLLLSYMFPKSKDISVLASAFIFVFWKSCFSQACIDFYNHYSFIQIKRVVDYSDLYVLPLLAIPHYIIKRIDSLQLIKIELVNPLFLLLPTVFALMATSPPKNYYYTRSGGNLKCYNCNIIVSYNQSEIIEKLKKADIVFDSIIPIDTFALRRVKSLQDENIHLYKLNSLVIDQDTLRNLDFAMRAIKPGKTKIYFNGMQVSDSIKNFKIERGFRKYYKRILFKELRSKLKD